jgi:hypothetical protein
VVENWSLIEIIWTLVAIPGLWFAWRNIQEASEDLFVVEENLPKTNGTTKLEWYKTLTFARVARSQDMIRGAMQGMYVLIGVFAAFLPPTTPRPLSPTNFEVAVGFLLTALLILSSLLLSLQSLRAYYARKKIMALQGQIDNYDG